MTASEKQMIPLEAIPETNADIQEQSSAAKDLLDVKFPSRPRRKVIIILGVIAVFTVVIIAAKSLIGKYVPDYLRDANSNSEKGLKDRGIRMLEESTLPPSSEPLDVPLGGESDSFADLELPENALLTEDGSVFSGNAKASVSVTDPRNQSDISSAPGDFSTMNEDGEEEILETYGMMKLSLEDDNGKPLVMSKPMKVYLDPDKLNLTVSDGNVSIKLYWLDRKTGRWRSVGDFVLEDGSKRRRKRSSHRVILAGTVTPAIAKEDLNFDKPDYRVGSRVTTNPAEDAVIITAIRQDHKGYVERVTKNGVICMPIWKDKKYYLQAETPEGDTRSRDLLRPPFAKTTK